MTSKPNRQDLYGGPSTKVEGRLQMPPMLEESLRLYRGVSIGLGTLCIVLGCSIGVYKSTLTPGITAAAATTHADQTLASSEASISWHNLPSEDLWISTIREVNNAPLPLHIKGSDRFKNEWIKKAGYHLTVGQLAMEQEQFSLAIQQLRTVLKMYPDIPTVRGWIGSIYLKQGLASQAIALFEKEHQIAPTFETVSNLGTSLLLAERFEDAEVYLLEAVALQPNHPGCHKNLAWLYRSTDRVDEALAEYAETLRLDPENLDWVTAFTDYLTELEQVDQATEVIRSFTKNTLQSHLLHAKIEARATNTTQSVEALSYVSQSLSPHLTLVEMNNADYDPIRGSSAFTKLTHQLELASITHGESR